MQAQATLSTIARSVNAVFAVVVAVFVATKYGDSATGKIVTVVVTSGVVALFEWLMIWAPRHFDSVRRLLDPRALFAGAWLQDVVRSHGTGAVEDDGSANSFAVLTVTYSKADDNYNIDGTAYTAAGDEHARWNSTDAVSFVKNGSTMTYEWRGAVTNRSLALSKPDRTGFARFSLPATDGGRGRVDHLGADRSLEINITRITKKWLDTRGLSGHDPATLGAPGERDRFARAYASVHARRVSG